MQKRLYYLDNLRVMLTILVIVFHTSIAYGAAGSWYYEDVDKSHINLTIVVLTIFTAVCQAFFMGLFFFISAYFTPGSYERKGAGRFFKDRLLRLGIPLVLYLFWLGPTTIYLSRYRNVETYGHFFQHTILRATRLNFGPLWFVEALLYFAILYMAYRALTRHRTAPARTLAFPTGKALLVTALLLGVVAFLVRLVYPTGTGPLKLQLGYFPSYILLFVAGVMAHRHNWLEQIPRTLMKKWRRTALFFIPILPIVFILTGALQGSLHMSGGVNLQAFFYAMWEPFVCIGICLWLLVWFQERFNQQEKWAKRLSDAAYAMYIIHPPIVVGVTLLFHRVPLFPFVKWLIVAPLAALICFALAMLLRRLPYAKKVL